MQATLINGKQIAEKLLTRATLLVEQLQTNGITPCMGVVLVGDDKPSRTYINHKAKAATSVGMDFHLYEYPDTISQASLISELALIQELPELSGLIVQLPLPAHINTPLILSHIRPEYDIDCLGDTNLGKLVTQSFTIEPPTPSSVFAILEDIGVDVVGKNITIVGAGTLVGKPLAIMLVNRQATVTICNKDTKNLTDYCLNADILISGVGKKDLIRGNMIRKGAIVIDAGVSFENGKMYGDVHLAEAKEVASYLTPTPGGVGPITVAGLILNTALNATKKNT